MCTFLRILFHLHQMHWHFRAGYFTTRVSTAFLLLRRAGGLEGKTVCGETQTWWFSTAEKNRCVCVCVCGYGPFFIQSVVLSWQQTLLPLETGVCQQIAGSFLDWTEWSGDRGDLQVGGWFPHDLKVRPMTQRHITPYRAHAHKLY